MMIAVQEGSNENTLQALKRPRASRLWHSAYNVVLGTVLGPLNVTERKGAQIQFKILFVQVSS